jgi:hypothetical protein
MGERTHRGVRVAFLGDVTACGARRLGHFLFMPGRMRRRGRWMCR